MPMRDHKGRSLPPAERSLDVTVAPGAGYVFVETAGRVALSETETRGLIGELWAAYARAFDTGTGS